MQFLYFNNKIGPIINKIGPLKTTRKVNQNPYGFSWLNVDLKYSNCISGKRATKANPYINKIVDLRGKLWPTEFIIQISV